jgi:Peptidase A4 family
LLAGLTHHGDPQTRRAGAVKATEELVVLTLGDLLVVANGHRLFQALRSKRGGTMAVVQLPGGGKVLTFAPPKSGFNPLKADESELLRHGFPRRPVEDPALLKRWERAMSRPFRVIVPQFRRLDYKKHHLRAAGRPSAERAVHGTETSSVWSGGVVYAPAGTTMKWVEGNWTVPNGYPPAGATDGVWYSASSWIFFDNANAGTVSGASLQAGSGNVINMVNASNAVNSTAIIETPTLVKCTYSG